MGGVRFSGTTRVGSVVAVIALSVAASFCRGRELPEGQCVFNSDCDNGAVCAGRYCRQPCNNRPGVAQDVRNRDCPAGHTCRPADTMGFYACYPPDAPYRCIYHSECNQVRNEICARDGFCRPQCADNYDCVVLTGNRSSVCVTAGDAGGGTCDFRVNVDAGDDDVHVEKDAAEEAGGGDGGADATGG